MADPDRLCRKLRIMWWSHWIDKKNAIVLIDVGCLNGTPLDLPAAKKFRETR